MRAQRHMERLVRKNPSITYDDLRLNLKGAGINVCRATVISSLREIGFGSYFAAHKPRLTERHKKRRLSWALSHVNWTSDRWKSVVWSDESRFSVTGADRRVRVLRKVGERYNKNCTRRKNITFNSMIISSTISTQMYISLYA